MMESSTVMMEYITISIMILFFVSQSFIIFSIDKEKKEIVARLDEARDQCQNLRKIIRELQDEMEAISKEEPEPSIDE